MYPRNTRKMSFNFSFQNKMNQMNINKALRKSNQRISRDNKELLLNYLLKLKNRIKFKLLKFFRRKSLIYNIYFIVYIKQYIKYKNYLIQNILSYRKKKIIFIQNQYRIYLCQKNLFSFAKKYKNYYSIYPSITPFLKNEKFLIKIYTDCNNYKKYSILPIYFCWIRNCYVFDIPKNKFLSYKKIFRFNFIINNKDILDNNYKIVKFGNFFVNEVDFVKYDKKENLLKINFLKKFKFSSNESELSYSEENINKKYSQTYTNFFSPKKEESFFNSSTSTKSSFKHFKGKKKRAKSILKTDKQTRMFKTCSSFYNINRRRVSFGATKFSY